MAWKNPIKAQIRLLVALDQIDQAILKTQRARDEIRTRVKEARQEIESFHTGLADLEQEIKSCAEHQHTSERELLKVERKLDKLSGFDKVTTAKEYQAAQRDLATLQERKDELETEILVAMEQLESLEERRLSFQKTIAVRKKSLTSQYEAWKSEYESLGEVLVRHKSDRDLTLSQLEPEFKATYLRLFARYGDRSVVTVVDDRCPGCQLTMPAQYIVDALMEEGIHNCPHCGRFVLPEELTNPEKDGSMEESK